MKATLFCLLWILLATPASTHAQSRVAYLPGVHETQQADPYRSRLFKVDGIPEITVFTPSGDIDMVYNPSIDGVQVDLYVNRGFSLWSGSRNLDNYRIIFRQSGNSITASVEKKQHSSGILGSDDVKFSFVIQSPKKITSNLRSMSGKVLLDGVEGRQFLQSDAGDLSLKNSEGELSLYSAAGAISMENNSGHIQVKSMAGDIEMAQNRGDIRVRTIAGNVRGRGLTGSFVCATVSGGIDVSFSRVQEGIQMETISGNVNLELMHLQGFDVHAKAMKVNTSLPASYITDRMTGRRATTLRLGDGGIPINISSVAGTVDIKQKTN